MIGTYTDPFGMAHIRKLGTGETYCGLEAAWARLAHPVDGCPSCVTEYTLDYARQEARRLCGPSDDQHL